MGFFQNLFGKASEDKPAVDPLAVLAPAEGTVVPLNEFPDAVFSQGVLGPGCGILPTGGTVVAPFYGKVTQSIDTKHAVGVTSDAGVELLIHVGVDTVDMQGKGFKSSVTLGQKIRPGDPLIEFDREVIKAAGYSDAIAVIVTNSDEFSSVVRSATGAISPGEQLLKVEKVKI